MQPIPISALPAYMQVQARAKAAYATSPKSFEQKPLTKSNGLFKPEELGKAKKKVRPTLTPDQAEYIVRSVNVSDDKNEVRIILNVSPLAVPTAQQKGVFVGKDGKAHFFTKAKVSKYEKALVKALSPYAHLIRSWGEVPIEVEFQFYFPFTSGTPKKNIHKFAPHISRPDADNLVKGILDSFTMANFWADDSLINNLISRKRRSTNTPCIVLRFKNMQPMFEELYLQEAGGEQGTLFNNSIKDSNGQQPDSV